jgi:hypothetical protein
VNSLNVVRVIVSPGPAHSFRVDVIGHNVAIVSELGATESALAVLRGDLSVEQFPHLSVGTEFAVSPRVMRILDPPDTQLPGR